jgi:septal ring factor EnvC (AmiA/AmiB activator)
VIIMEEKELAETTFRSKENSKKIEHLEKSIESIQQLLLSVKELATEMKHMREDITKLDTRMIEIENKPAKRWESLIASIISILVGAIMGVIISKLGF